MSTATKTLTRDQRAARASVVLATCAVYTFIICFFLGLTGCAAQRQMTFDEYLAAQRPKIQVEAEEIIVGALTITLKSDRPLQGVIVTWRFFENNRHVAIGQLEEKVENQYISIIGVSTNDIFAELPAADKCITASVEYEASPNCIIPAAALTMCRDGNRMILADYANKESWLITKDGSERIMPSPPR